MGIKQECIAFVGEVVGTTMFLFLGLGGIQTAINSETVSQQQTAASIGLSNQTVLFISTSMGLSLLVSAWLFYRITGGLFNPSVTLALWLIGGLETVRAVSLTIAQFAGGMLGAGLVELLTPYSVTITQTTLAQGMNYGQGLMLEAFLTAMLVFSVLMLAAEKHRATYLAPIGIGLVLFVCQLFGTQWTGCGMNQARSLGPSVIAHSFPGYFWIYIVGPYLGALIATGFYLLLKAFDYGSVVLGQDTDDTSKSPMPVYEKFWKAHGFSSAHRSAMQAAGVSSTQIDRAEKGFMAQTEAGDRRNGHVVSNGDARLSNSTNTTNQTMVDARPSKKKSSRTAAKRTDSAYMLTDPAGQDRGGIAAPGTHASLGRAVHGIARKN